MRSSLRRSQKLCTLAVLLIVSGCSSDTCTLIGPLTGITVEFSPAPTGPLRVEVTSGQIGAFVYDCTDTTGCATRLDIPDYYPTSASVKVTYQGRVKTVPIAPEFIESEVNGPDCGKSRHASVTIALP
jgi:hypothetical protein